MSKYSNTSISRKKFFTFSGSTEPHPQAPSKSKPSKPADETSDEGLIEDSDDEPPPAPVKETPKAGKAAAKSGGNKLSVFQKQKPTPTISEKTPTKPSKPPKPPKAEKTPKTPNEKKQGPGRPRGRKKKIGNYQFTVWKFQDFSVIQILCESNFGEVRSSKTAILTSLLTSRIAKIDFT